jgi:hypothetical protein
MRQGDLINVQFSIPNSHPKGRGPGPFHSDENWELRIEH